MVVRALVLGVLGFGIVAVPAAGSARAQGLKLSGPLARPVGGDVEEFRVTADGSRVVYVADQESDDVLELFSAPTDGSLPPLKLNQPLAPGSEVGLANLRLAPDSTRVAFQVNDGFGPGELWSAPVDGGAPAVLLAARATAFLFTPDSSQVLFTGDLSTPGTTELFRVPSDASAAPVRVSGPALGGGLVRAFEGEPCQLSADGTRAVYAADHHVLGRQELYSVPIDGSLAPVRLNGVPVAGGQVQAALFGRSPMRISADGTRVVYRADQEVNDRFELYSVPIDGSAAPVKLNGALVSGGDVAGGQFAPSFAEVPDFRLTPDGQSVVYRADQDLDNVFALYVAPVAGGTSALALTNSGPGGRSVLEYDLSPDSSRVVFVSDQRVLRWELFVAPLDGSREPVVLNLPLVAGGEVTGSFDASFRISADSRWVVYRADQESDQRFELFRVPLAGRRFVRRSDGGPSPLLPLKLNPPLEPFTNVGSFALDASSTHVVLEMGAALFRAPLATIGPAARLDSPAASHTGARFTLGTTRVLFVANTSLDLVSELFAAELDASAPAVRVSGDLPLGPIQGDALNHEFSPDSRWLVYSADGDQDELLELYSTPASGRARVRKLNGPLHPFSSGITLYTIHPASSHVLYLAAVDEPSAGDLYIVPIDGSQPPLRLSSPPVAGGSVSMHAFSPDGSRVVYRADQDTDNVHELFVVPSDGSAAALRLHPPYAPGQGLLAFEISPDGTRVVYAAVQDTAGVTELYVVPSDGSAAPAKLSAPFVPGGSVVSFRIAPDGGRALYLADQLVLARRDLFSVPLDGSLAAVQLNGAMANDRDVQPDFQISPDSSRVVYRANPAFPQVELYSAALDGSAAPVQLNPPATVPFVEGEVFAFHLSPDSSRVAFLGDDPSVAGSAFELWSRALDGSGVPVQLNTVGEFVAEVRIAADGQRVVYTGDGVYGAPLDGSAPAVALGPTLPQGAHSLRLTADGRRALYVVENAQTFSEELFLVPVDGSHGPRLVNRPFPSFASLRGNLDGGEAFELSPDSSRVVYRADQETDRVAELFLSLLEHGALPSGPP